jgi:hypothetical protein
MKEAEAVDMKEAVATPQEATLDQPTLEELQPVWVVAGLLAGRVEEP